MRTIEIYKFTVGKKKRRETMTTKEKVKAVMELWQNFCNLHGGRGRMNLNIFSLWRDYLKKNLGEG